MDCPRWLLSGTSTAKEGSKQLCVVHKELYHKCAEHKQREAEEFQQHKTMLKEPTTGNHNKASLYGSPSTLWALARPYHS
jgi:hypothetical protein